MKIGFRLSEAIRDISHGNIDINDVAFVVSLTAVRDDRKLSDIVDNWINSTVLDVAHRDLYIKTLEQLFKDNKVIQPKLQGMPRHWIPENNACWMDMFPSAAPKNVAIQSAWDNYRIVSALS